MRFLKLGLIGHNRTIGIVTKIMSQSFADIEITEIPMDTTDIMPVVTYLKANEQNFYGCCLPAKRLMILSIWLLFQKSLGCIYNTTPRGY